MIPTGDFKRLKQDILIHYHEEDEVTFGILLADPRQSETREYIYNYIDVFNKRAGRLFDFFIPGYEKIIDEGGPYNIRGEHPTTSVAYLGNEHYRMQSENVGFIFKRTLFNDFCNGIEKCLGIRYTFNPMLILMEIKPGYIDTARYIVIELDDNERHNVRRSGEFFLALFDALRFSSDLQFIQEHMIKTYIRGNLIDRIIRAIGSDWLTEVAQIGNEINRYRIKSFR